MLGSFSHLSDGSTSGPKLVQSLRGGQELLRPLFVNKSKFELAKIAYHCSELCHFLFGLEMSWYRPERSGVE
jgi:hypothetical protein